MYSNQLHFYLQILLAILKTYTNLIKAIAVKTALRLLAYLPLTWIKRLAKFLALRLLSFPNLSLIRVIRLNIQHCFPQLTPEQQQQLLKNNLIETLRTFLSLGLVWFAPVDKVLALIKTVENEALLTQALQRKKGVILLSLHLGGWEIGGLYLGRKLHLTSLYKPPKINALHPMIKQVRQRSNGTMVATDANGVRQLLKVLRQGQCVGILPDHDPEQNNGVFAPLFGISAHTMTLIAKLARKTGATVLFVYAERVNDDNYCLHYAPALPEIADKDLSRATTALNQGIEHCIRRHPSQYLWAYKRFKRHPQGLPNIYESDEN